MYLCKKENRMKLSHYILMFFCSLSLTAFGQKSSEQSTFRTAFYNLENLFDIEDNPEKKDEDFLPEGKKEWTQERYDKKMIDLEKVVEALGFPAILGVCEVENKRVLSDFILQDEMAKVHYDIVHFESPDMRGIDVGLLFDTDLFKLDSSSFIRVTFPEWLEPEGYTSRDILYAKLVNKEGEAFNVFVNHWPSRRGGAEASEKRRVWVASHLRRAVNRVFAEDLDAKIIIMGDFNDEASNNSIAHALGTLDVEESTFLLPGLLYNHFLSLETKGEGSYNYRGDWNMLDQIIIGGFNSDWTSTDFGILKEDWMLYTNDKGSSPSKTYGGPNYYGGYSDHLPVYMDFGKE